MLKINTSITKTLLAAIFALVSAAAGTIAVPFLILCALMCADFLTGLLKSRQNGTVSSKAGFKGFVKKLCYAFAVAAAIGIDYAVYTGSGLLGQTGSFNPIFTLISLSWLIVNESISILENLGEMGLPLPGFLLKAGRNLKNKYEKEGGKHFDQ